jgi:DNA polymerase-1
LVGVSAIDTMLSNFILPLQENADDRSRVHCSLNLNTETGRLSSRAPNLQNQPALEKDQYRIREAFCAEKGNALVVADYGQLELRLLAHMTNCQSMIEAFASGGCFHSRTAMGMFDHVKEAVDSGECLLEWDYSKGDPPAPLLKDMFGSERRRAKTLNFSIAYGKTVHGLSKDWGVTVQEAKAMLDAWYADRPEVREWQHNTIAAAHKYGWTRTLMGRYRQLNGIQDGPRATVAHLERAAINTPIQGGAADIMTLAMIKLKRSEVLRRLGYRLLLQIHDEVILEGPEEHALAAKAEVVACMENPFDEALPSLQVDLVVDAKTAPNWFEAK